MHTKVLVVDDNADNRALLKRVLQPTGWLIAEADTGAAALAVLKSGGADLVLLDIGMPGMSGIEVLKQIRAKRTPEELPVVMITGSERISDAIEACANGANDYLRKPLRVRDVVARLKRHLIHA
jgi:DNA-binding response OmpR family regulator